MSPQSADYIDSFLERNLNYSKTTHVAPPMIMDIMKRNKSLGKRGTTIITCSDPRVIPERFLALENGEAGVIRNAGGRVRPAIPTLLVLDSIADMGTILIIHHTDCGMTHSTEKEFRDKTKERHPEIAFPAEEKFGAIDDPYESIKEDVEYLKSFEIWEKSGVEIVGLVLDTATGVTKRVV